MSTTQETRNKATFERFDAAVKTRDMELITKTIDDLVDPDVVINIPLPVTATGAEAYKQLWAMLLRAFPDLHTKVEDVIADGDKVVIRNTVTGTQHGEYMGRPPTGKSVTYKEMFILRFANDRIVETWGIVDVLSQMKQLGIQP